MLFHTAGKGDVEIGMVLTAWKGIKSPKPHNGEVLINSCSALRCIVLDMLVESDSTRWTCSSKSPCFVVRIESLIAVLDCVRSVFASIQYTVGIARDCTCYASLCQNVGLQMLVIVLNFQFSVPIYYKMSVPRIDY